jgi:predicted DNA-binding transcriptional regulator AlpA
MNIDSEPKYPRFLDLTEVSLRLCLKTSSIYELFNSGELVRVKLGRKKTVVLESDVTDFINRKVAEARQKIAA